MKKLLILALIAACSTTVYRTQDTPITTVQNLDAEKYLGTWYEIARYPNWFERDCVGVTANYTKRDDGQINVKNTCLKSTQNNAVEVANGLARIESPGKLSVTFTPWLPIVPRGDYWILGLNGYDIAVVGNPSGKTGWILSRAAKLNEADIAWAKNILIKNGYNTDGLEWVDQSMNMK